MLNRYFTTHKTAEAEIIEKKSRFIGYMKPIGTEEEALNYIQAIKKMHHSARHHVFAYRVGLEQGVQRYSDDGEPSGTAGMPVLNVLSSVPIENTVAVVVRYFGGTLLGTGGLVRAYTNAAKAALAESGLIEMAHCSKLRLETNYTQAGKLQHAFVENGYNIQAIAYLENVVFELVIESDRQEYFLKQVEEWTNAKYIPESLGTGYMPLSQIKTN